MYKFYSRYIAPPDVTPENRIFSPEHLILSTILFVLIILIMRRVFREDEKSYSQKALRRCALIMLVLEVFRISWNWYYHGFSLTIFRFDYCNQICLVLPLIVLFLKDSYYPYVQELALFGGLTVLIYPLWVFYDYAGIHLMAVQSMCSHALMVLCALLMPMASGKIPDSQSTIKTWVGFFVICIVAFLMTHITGVNYLLMAGARDVPIIDHIPYPWYWALLIPLFLTVSTLFTKFWARWYRAQLNLKPGARFIYSERRNQAPSQKPASPTNRSGMQVNG